MQLKLRHLCLFAVACITLILGNFPGGSLLAMAALLQLNLLICGISLSKSSQIAAFKLFLYSIPVLFFWAGAHSFIEIYLKEASYSFGAMATVISLGLSFLIYFQVIFVFKHLELNHFNVGGAIQAALGDIKNKRAHLLKWSLILFILTLVPGLTSDWKLIFAVLVTQLSLNFDRAKKAAANF